MLSLWERGVLSLLPKSFIQVAVFTRNLFIFCHDALVLFFVDETEYEYSGSEEEEEEVPEQEGEPR